MPSFPHYRQLDAMDCGPTCLRMIAKHYGKAFSLQELRDKSGFSREGVSLLGIAEAAEQIGFRTISVKVTFEKLIAEAPLPCIVHWHQNHFVVVYGVAHKKWMNLAPLGLNIADPAKGLRKLSAAEFCKGWLSTQHNGESVGIALLLEPTPQFYETSTENQGAKGLNFAMLRRYILPYKALIAQLVLGLLVGSGLQLLFPFLTQSVVDVGIQTQNLAFIYLVLLGQLMLFAARTAVDFIRGWILLHISVRLNLSILSDFLIKLMRLPMTFFDTKMYGDLMQRINDHHRIEAFLTGQTLNVLFSLFNLLVFGVVLALYNLQIFFIFLMASVLYAGWVMVFLKERRKLDYRMFDASARNQSSLVQLIQGMQEIKLNRAEYLKRWEWERLQAMIFKFQMKGLALNQTQQAGAFFINEGKNILITFLSAKAVVDGHLTLCSMLSVQYIMGQLNSPIEQLIGFVQIAQSAKISLERLNEVHQIEDEEPPKQTWVNELPKDRSLYVKNVSFTYPGAGMTPVLQDINLSIPAGKVTAIVGMSGSGKTTLLKLLLKFYDPTKGEISLQKLPLTSLGTSYWRGCCGVVMQDGFIFSDTIARNIAVGDETPNKPRLLHACEMANILDFVESMPLGFNTKIGAEGNGISQGQRQRLLIARAVYKNPAYLFFDEATNALDANNEQVILENLGKFFRGRTVVVVAHRLSTVKNADQIVVLHQGIITEVGTHTELTQQRGEYYALVKNQLELGN